LFWLATSTGTVMNVDISQIKSSLWIDTMKSKSHVALCRRFYLNGTINQLINGTGASFFVLLGVFRHKKCLK
jgi:hypothetical protein